MFLQVLHDFQLRRLLNDDLLPPVYRQLVVCVAILVVHLVKRNPEELTCLVVVLVRIVRVVDLIGKSELACVFEVSVDDVVFSKPELAVPLLGVDWIPQGRLDFLQATTKSKQRSRVRDAESQD